MDRQEKSPSRLGSVRSSSGGAAGGSMRLPSNNSIHPGEKEKKRRETNKGNTMGSSSNHPRSASYDVYNEMTRPGSRVGFVDPVKYSHYLNYDEIRHHLK